MTLPWSPRWPNWIKVLRMGVTVEETPTRKMIDLPEKDYTRSLGRSGPGPGSRPPIRPLLRAQGFQLPKEIA